MRQPDRFLVAILAGAVALVVAALVTARRTPAPTYGPEDSPDGVVNNYVLALRQDDDARAFGYLDPALAGHPGTLERFQEDIGDCSWCFGDASAPETVRVDPAEFDGDQADVQVRVITFREDGLFGSSEYVSTYGFRLVRRDGAWRIQRAERYWSDCWHDPDACADRDPTYRRPSRAPATATLP